MFILKYNISWSGGKDSTATIILAHELKIPINEIIYCRVMYNEYIPADLPIMSKFIDDSIKFFTEWGYKVRIVKPKKLLLTLHIQNINVLHILNVTENIMELVPFVEVIAECQDLRVKP